MPAQPQDPDAHMLRPWHEPGVGQPFVVSGDTDSARHRLERSVGDDVAMGALRLTASVLSDGAELWRLDDHQLVGHLAAAVAQGRLRGRGVAPKLLRLVPAETPAVSAPPPPSRPRTPSPVAAPAPAPTSFPPDIDADAMAQVLRDAARDGTPLCEICRQAAAQEAGA